MQVQDLRIGNYIKWIDNVVKVDLEILKLVSENPGWAKPIPITMDMIHECFRAEYGDYNIYGFKASYYKGELYVYFEDVPKKVEYVHQLQNLIHAFCGVHIDIKF
jgi:hypothetical protein